jgi:hypothetical protein
MMKTQHTSGPWEVIRESLTSSAKKIIGPNAEHICEGLSWGENEDADAALIAAAPDLLEALESVIDSWQYGETPSDAAATYDHARSAIAKAKGEQA